MKKISDTVSYEVIYKNGHFYSLENQRLVFKENTMFHISGAENSIQTNDELLETHPIRLTEGMKNYVTEKYGEENIIFLLKSGTRFRFKFGLGRKKSDVKNKRYEFEGLFLEDVYLYHIAGSPVEEVESWRVVDCITSIEKSLEPDFELSEPITAESPAKAFAMLIGTHFDRQRSTSLKIYDYYEVIEKEVIRKYCPLSNEPLSLGQLRRIAVELLPKEDESASSPRL